MAPWRRFTIVVALIASLAVLILAVYLLWNARQWDYLPFGASSLVDPGLRAQVLQDRVELYSRRVNDLQSLVILLLGICGLYTVIFVLSAHFSALSFNRQADRAVARMKDQLGLAMGDLRALKEDTQTELSRIYERAGTLLSALPKEAPKEPTHEPQADPAPSAPPDTSAETLDQNLAALERRLAALAGQRLGEDEMQELVHSETAVPAIELIASPRSLSTLTAIYRSFGALYASRDLPRARFYLQRALALTPADFQTENEFGMLELGRRPPAINAARDHFEDSLRIEDHQQRARYGLALANRADHRPEVAEREFEEALACQNWEVAPDPDRTAHIHYDLACLLAELAAYDTERRTSSYRRAAHELSCAFQWPSRELELRLARDTEEDGCLCELASSHLFGQMVDELLLNMRVEGA